MLNFFKKKTEWKGNEIYSVVDGRLKKLEKVADPAFAQKMLGDGAAIDPQNELIVAPCEGINYDDVSDSACIWNYQHRWG